MDLEKLDDIEDLYSKRCEETPDYEIKKENVLKENRKKFASQSGGKRWGEDGFVGKMSFGCYVYDVFFADLRVIGRLADLREFGKCYGAVSYDKQVIVIRSDVTEQMKRLTMWHEIVHIMLENNNVGRKEDDDEKVSPVKEENFTDNLASRIYEITCRNSEMMEWLMGWKAGGVNGFA